MTLFDVRSFVALLLTSRANQSPFGHRYLNAPTYQLAPDRTERRVAAVEPDIYIFIYNL